jgi:YNFM family putative membrane transporter
MRDVVNEIVSMNEPAFIRRGTKAYRRASLSLLFAGLGTFNLLYAVQPLMPVFSQYFRVGADETALLLSLTTCLLAGSLLAAAPIADRFGRKPVMIASICIASMLTLVASTVENWHLLLATRALLGIFLGGVPAVAMTYLAEEIEPGAVSAAMGFYIGGNAIGGLVGRLLNGFLADISSWHLSLAVTGGLGLISAAMIACLLPRSRVFVRRRSGGRPAKGIYRRHLRNPVIVLLLLEATILSGVFVTTFNLIGYRLNGPPFNLSVTLTSLVFVAYLLGTPATILTGHRFGHMHPARRIIIGIGLMMAGVSCGLIESIAAIVLGIALLTIGFFVAHASASEWISGGRNEGQAQAASLYLFSFYAGSGLASWIGGHVWAAWAWPGVTFFLIGLLVLGFATAAMARRF